MGFREFLIGLMKRRTGDQPTTDHVIPSVDEFSNSELQMLNLNTAFFEELYAQNLATQEMLLRSGFFDVDDDEAGPKPPFFPIS